MEGFEFLFKIKNFVCLIFLFSPPQNFPGSQYLVLQGDQIFGTTLLQKPEESAEFEFEEELFDEETADEFHLLDEKKKEDILFIEYHILYSEVYQCPVLYFQPHFQGQSNLFDL